MGQLTSLDAQFMAMETRRTYGHLTGLAIHDPATAPGGHLTCPRGCICCRRSAGAWPRCRSTSTTPSGSRTRTSTSTCTTDGVGLNITCLSHMGQVDFGIVADRDQVDDAWPFMQGIEHALEELGEALAPQRA